MHDSISTLADFAKPLHCFCVIWRDAFACLICATKTKLGTLISLRSGLTKPFDGFGIIVWHTYAFVIHQAYAFLCIGATLFCCLAIPYCCLGVILCHAIAVIKHQAKVVLCRLIALLCGFANPLCSLDIIMRNTLAPVIHEAKVQLRFGDTLLRSLYDTISLPRRSLLWRRQREYEPFSYIEPSWYCAMASPPLGLGSGFHPSTKENPQNTGQRVR